MIGRCSNTSRTLLFQEADGSGVSQTDISSCKSVLSFKQRFYTRPSLRYTLRWMHLCFLCLAILIRCCFTHFVDQEAVNMWSLDLRSQLLYILHLVTCVCVRLLFVLIQSFWPFVFEEGSPASQGRPQGCHGDKRSDFLNSWPIPRYISRAGNLDLGSKLEWKKGRKANTILLKWVYQSRENLQKPCLNKEEGHWRNKRAIWINSLSLKVSIYCS